MKKIQDKQSAALPERPLRKHEECWDKFLLLKRAVDELETLSDEISNTERPAEDLLKEGVDRGSLESVLTYLPNRLEEQEKRIWSLINEIKDKLFYDNEDRA